MGWSGALQSAIDGPESRQLFHGEITRTGQRTVIDRRKYVHWKGRRDPARAGHIKGIRTMVQLIEEQGREELSTAQRSASMAGLCSVDHAHNVPPYLGGSGFELGVP